NGTKMWVTNGSHASVLTLFATVDRGRGHKGVTAFLVEPTFPGFALGKLERKMGVRGSPTVAIHLADCQVPIENRLGNEGEGFRVALGALDRSRPAVGAQAVGIAQAALDAAVGYAKERRQFGQPIATFQGIQFMLADMAMAVHASRLTVHHAAALVDRGAARVVEPPRPACCRSSTLWCARSWHRGCNPSFRSGESASREGKQHETPEWSDHHGDAGSAGLGHGPRDGANLQGPRQQREAIERRGSRHRR